MLNFLNDSQDSICMLRPNSSKYIFKNKSWKELQNVLLRQNRE
jgi:hypothetical protein